MYYIDIAINTKEEINNSQLEIRLPISEKEIIFILKSHNILKSKIYSLSLLKTNIRFIEKYISDYDDLLDINNLFNILNQLSKEEIEKLNILLELKPIYGSKKVIESIFNLDKLKLNANIKTYEDLAKSIFYDIDFEDIKKHCDLDEIGKKIELRENGKLSSRGYYKYEK